MSAIYIHIPICKSKCGYCDFYSEVADIVDPQLIDCIKLEIETRAQQKEWFSDVTTIYFGGGTPSVLSVHQIKELLLCLHDNFIVSKNAEITMEVNPDDLSQSYLTELMIAGVNRLSIGLQSIDNSLLAQMNRRHNADQAIDSLQLARKAGFKNLSIDLIYGMTGLSITDWKNTLQTVLQYLPEHVSAYHLSFETGTPFFKLREIGRMSEIDDAESAKQYELLIQQTDIAGYEHYEISNFALPQYRSKHNQKYWHGEKYLGFGPAAHSYNGNNRYWNISNNQQYIKSIKGNEPWFESEQLTIKDKFNEYLMTRLRTVEGADLDYINTNFGASYYSQLLQQTKDIDLLKIHDNKLYTENKNWFISDAYISELFIV
ncbi:radical SAM family heme chaperone HemW [Bacteroidales bacterium]|nr:radical SAM family heme chaperone HemW [Bacteroidales bacterium]